MSSLWTKKGVILKPDSNTPWMHTWASATSATNRGRNSTIQLYITGREKNGASRIGTGVLHIPTLTIKKISNTPCIPLGEHGMFDEHGTSYPSVVCTNNTYSLYYVGWIKGVGVPWYNAIGMATSTDGIHFKKISDAPIFDRNFSDPIGVGSCFVMKEKAKWTMWYTSFNRWEQKQNEMKHFYHIKHAISKDGIQWTPSGRVCIGFATNKEYAIAKPTVLKTRSGYIMWYSFRGNAYHIGCATSKDGITWNRQDKTLGLLPSENGWDSQMVCYPDVFVHKNTIYMLYNGNGYGKSGLGIATVQVSKLEQYL